MGDYAKESSHWYMKDGDACHEVENKSKGGMRPTRITDAKKLGLLPSVTTILSCIAKPALTSWLVDQGIMSALTSPHLGRYEAGELTDKDFLDLLNAEAREQARKAAEEGKRVHGYIEAYFKRDLFPMDDGWNYVDAVRDIMLGELDLSYQTNKWSAENSFPSSALVPKGYAGKVDLHNSQAVIDFKTVDKDLSTVKGYDEQVAQLAAYRYGLGLSDDTRLINIYIHRKTAECKAIEWSPEDAKRGLDIFMAAFDLWKAKNKFGEKYGN